MKWVTLTKYVDLETGEILPKSKIKNYIKIKSHYKTEQRKTYYLKEYIIEVRPSKQTQLWKNI